MAYSTSPTGTNNYSFGTVATYVCDPDYAASDGGSRTCQEGDGQGVWSDPPITCESA